MTENKKPKHGQADIHEYPSNPISDNFGKMPLIKPT
jgi:hypothetical protein